MNLTRKIIFYFLITIIFGKTLAQGMKLECVYIDDDLKTRSVFTQTKFQSTILENRLWGINLVELNLSYKEALNNCFEAIESSNSLPNPTLVDIYAYNSLLKKSYQIVYAKNSNDSNGMELPFDKFVVFGDSLSDSANFFRTLSQVYNIRAKLLRKKKSSEMYWNKRFSNGPNYLDYIRGFYNKGNNSLAPTSSGLGLPIINYATGLAVTSKDNAYLNFITTRRKILPHQIPDLKTQIDTFIKDYKNSNLLDNSLVVLWIGGNDLLWTNHDSKQIVNVIKDQLNLILSQTKLRYFVIPTLPDISTAPVVLQYPYDLSILQDEVNKINYELNYAIDDLKIQYPDTVVIRPNFNDGLHSIVTDNLLQQNKEECQKEDGNSIRCKNPQDMIFWDYIHPTTTLHCYFGRLITNEIARQFNLTLPYKAPQNEKEIISECKSNFIALI